MGGHSLSFASARRNGLRRSVRLARDFFRREPLLALRRHITRAASTRSASSRSRVISVTVHREALEEERRDLALQLAHGPALAERLNLVEGAGLEPVHGDQDTVVCPGQHGGKQGIRWRRKVLRRGTFFRQAGKVPHCGTFVGPAEILRPSIERPLLSNIRSMRIDLDGFSRVRPPLGDAVPTLRVRWAALLGLGLGLATACGNRGGGDAAPATTAAPTINIGMGQPAGGGLGAVPGGLAGPQGQPGSGGPGVTPPVPASGGNAGSGQPGSTFPGGGSKPASGGPAGPGTPQKGGYSSGH